jgi:predicted nucleotidyltransferase
MKRRFVQDPYRQVIKSFNHKGVRYVVVGMSGINYYARNPSETFGTMDYDIFVEPTQDNLTKAINVLKQLGFLLDTAKGPFNKDDLKQLLGQYQTLIATTSEGIMVELILKISGYSFSQLAKDAKTFDLQGVPVRVGRLTQLLGSKQIAGRPKDLQFLKRYRIVCNGS